MYTIKGKKYKYPAAFYPLKFWRSEGHTGLTPLCLGWFLSQWLHRPYSALFLKTKISELIKYKGPLYIYFSFCRDIKSWIISYSAPWSSSACTLTILSFSGKYNKGRQGFFDRYIAIAKGRIKNNIVNKEVDTPYDYERPDGHTMYCKGYKWRTVSESNLTDLEKFLDWVKVQE